MGNTGLDRISLQVLLLARISEQIIDEQRLGLVAIYRQLHLTLRDQKSLLRVGWDQRDLSIVVRTTLGEHYIKRSDRICCELCCFCRGYEDEIAGDPTTEGEILPSDHGNP
jgi:hypothetical protein